MNRDNPHEASAADDAGAVDNDLRQRKLLQLCGYDPGKYPEPTLAELLRDPLIQRLMTSDGVRVGDVERLLRRIGGLLGGAQ
jgi:hypothetical protein